MFQAGWDVNDHGKIRYLPLGDNGMFNWQTLPKSNWPDVYDIILSKEENNELLGINLIYKEFNRGGIFHISNESIHFFPTINRKIIFDNYKVTDFSWYINKLFLCIDPQKLRISKIEMEQVFD